MASKKTVSLANILRVIFDKPLDWSPESEQYLTLSRDQKLKSLLRKYTARVAREQDRYQPFVRIANHIIQTLWEGNERQQEDPPFQLCRNDPVMVQGSDAKRYPDCVSVPRKLLEDKRREPKKVGEKGPKRLPFHWREITAFFEFKMEEDDLMIAKDLSTTFVITESQRDQIALGQLLDAPVISSGDGSTSRAGGSALKRGPEGSPQNQRNLQRRRTATYAPAHHSGQLDSPDDDNSEDNSSNHDDPKDADYLYETETSSGSQSSDGDNSEPEGSHKGEEQDKATPIDHAVQCASYAAEMLSRGNIVTHRLGFLITDQYIQTQYYDHSIILTTEAVDFVKHPHILVAIFDCLVSASEKEWGRMDAVQIPDQKTPKSRKEIRTLDMSYLSSSTLQCRDVNAKLFLKEVLFRQHSIVGRGTCVVRVKSDMEAWEGRVESLVLKISFRPRGRIAEGKRLSEIQDFVERNPRHKGILKHLPERLHSERLPEDTVATQVRIAHFLALNAIPYELRDVEILVMTELRPIKSIKQGNKLLTALVGVVTAYKWLYEEMKLLHRDVSVENMMYRLNSEGNVVGVLNDYDLSIMLSEQENGPVSKQRTGTIPYMAIELLELADGNGPPLHLCRHDLESMMYAILDLACFRHLPEQERKKSPIRKWFTVEYPAEDLAESKSAFFLKNKIPNTSNGMEELSLLVRQLYKMFRQGHIARGDANDLESSNTEDGFDGDTLGGHVTLEKFATLFGI